MTTKVVEATGTQPLYERVADDDDYEDFEWVAVEQKFAARPIESETQKGWAFFELDSVDPSKGGAPRAHVDALRLLAVFLAHWDNKAENQRLVCLSKTWPEGTTCPEPFLILQDVGSTFGPRTSGSRGMGAVEGLGGPRGVQAVDEGSALRRRDLRVRRTSRKAGARFLGDLLHQLTDAQLTDLFTWARFDKPRSRAEGDEVGAGLGPRVQDTRARDQRRAAVS